MEEHTLVVAVLSILLPIQFYVYQHICGIVKAYQYYSTDGFERGPRLPSYNTIDTAYVDGVSVTHGSPRRHVWSYAAAPSEQLYAEYRCPCTPNNPTAGRNVPISLLVNIFTVKVHFLMNIPICLQARQPILHFSCSSPHYI